MIPNSAKQYITIQKILTQRIYIYIQCISANIRAFVVVIISAFKY